MPERVSPSTRPAPEWASRTLFAFVVLSLAALIAIPWATERRLQPTRDELNLLADSGRGLITTMHLHMAQQVLKHLVQVQERKVTIDALQKAVAERLQIKQSQLK